LLLYVDDIVLTASTSALLRRTIDALQLEFSMKDLGPLHHFLGISVHQHQDGLFLSQRQYILDIVERAVMSEGKPCSTPVDTHAKVPADIGPPVSDRTSLQESCGCSPLPHLHPAWYFLCCPADLSTYAWFARAPLVFCQASHTVSSWHSQLWSSSSSWHTSELTVYTNADWASPPSHKHQRPLHKLDWMVSQDIQASDLQHLMCASTDSIEVCKPRLTLS